MATLFSSSKIRAMLIIFAVAHSAVAGAFLTSGSASVQKAYILNAAGEPTLKVTGDASANLAPDQATVIVNVQTPLADLDSLLDEQYEKIRDNRSPS